VKEERRRREDKAKEEMYVLSKSPFSVLSTPFLGDFHA
jgi:hypothetical protein